MRRRPVSFRRARDFRAWLDANGASTTELYVRCFKVHAAEKGMTYAQALDEALCFGWIDGVRHAVDDVSFSVRFTPRKKGSVWSAVNIRHIARLDRERRLRSAGRAAFDARLAEATGRYSFESKPVALAPALLRRLRANAEAWRDFQRRPPWYRRRASFWVMSAKQEPTRLRRLAVLIASLEQGAPAPPLASKK